MKKKYLVIGATSGIGLQFVKNNIKKNLIYCLGRNFKQLDDFIKKEQLKHNYRKIRIDFLKKNSIKIIKKLNKIDSIILCAGYTKLRLIKYFSKKEFEDILNVNLIKPINIIAEIYGNNLINEGGSIVVLSSLVSFGAMKGSFSYSISKSALNASVRGMAKEFSEKNINVNGIAPAMVETPLIEQAKKIQNNLLTQDKSKYLLGKRYLSTQEVVNLVEFLISNKSKKITGQIIIIDAGYSLNV